MEFLHILVGLLVVAAAFGFIIFIHELGHFITARAVGIRCPQFAIGFGPALFSFRWRGTLFGLRVFPLGGYVLMVGEDPNADAGDSWHDKVSVVLEGVTFPTTPRAILAHLETAPPPALEADLVDGEMAPESSTLVTPTDREEILEHLRFLKPDEVFQRQEALEGNFNHKSFPQRIAVILGGVTMNFIAATLLLWGLGFSIGLGGGDQVPVARAAEVSPGSAAQFAGLQAEDIVLAVNGQSVLSGSSMVHELSGHPAQEIPLTILRAGKTLEVKVTPDVVVDGLFISGHEAHPQVYVPERLKEYTKKLGAASGDVITAVNLQTVDTPQEFVEAVKAALPNERDSGAEKKIKLTLSRQGKDPIVLEATPSELKPLGKIGVDLANVLSLGFHRFSTNKIIEVTPGSTVAQLGLQADDILYSVDGLPIGDLPALNDSLARLSSSWTSGHSVPVIVLRGPDDDNRERVSSVLRAAPPADAQAFGVKLEPISTSMILAAPFTLITKFVFAPITIAHDLAMGAIKPKTLGKSSAGPLGMMQMIYEVSGNGIPTLLFFLAILNAAVGAFNVIPFPALDGSRCLILILAWVRGKEFDPTKEAQLHFGGLLVLLTSVVLITVQDVIRLWSGVHLMK